LSYFRLDYNMQLPHVILLTGKGGTGKSSAAGALALALSHRGKTVLADFDQRQTSARLLEASLDARGNSQVTKNLELRTLTPRNELESFIERIVPIKAISRRMLRSHTFGYVTAALPGLESFLMLERLRQLAEEAAARDGFAVIDAPASGGVLELLSVPQGVKDLAPSGTLNRLARAIDEFLENPRRFGVWVTARPERLAVREAIETLSNLRDKLGIGNVAAILNAVPAPLFSPADFTKIQQLGAHRSLAVQRKVSCDLAARARKQFERVGVEVIELPMLFTSEFARPQLEILAGTLDRLARSENKEESTRTPKHVRNT
jgi:anion-transporting  ArsA/GET3 family ATPase